MKVTYAGTSTYSCAAREDSCTLQADQGSFSLVGKESRYAGIHFFLKDTIFKVAEPLAAKDAGDLSTVIIKPGMIIREFANIKEVSSIKGNCYEAMFDRESIIPLYLDPRHPYDLGEFDRYFSVEEKPGSLKVLYEKRGKDVFQMHILIRHHGAFKAAGMWVEKKYPADKKRDSPPFSRYVYYLGDIACQKVELSAGLTLGSAVPLTIPKLSFSFPLKQVDDQRDALGLQAASSLKGLILNNSLYAGLPWFFQSWARDSLISLRGLVLCGERESARRIMMDLISTLQPDGRVPNRVPATTLGNADAIGWLCLRIEQHKDIFARKDLAIIKKALITAEQNLVQRYGEDGLIKNYPLETWMDTRYMDDVRGGLRIEIQALYGAMLRLLFSLTNDPLYQKKIKQLKRKVKESFVAGSLLCDGAGDRTQRPNLFIAYYVFPDLFSKAEWAGFFDKAIESLWLPWGGLATIEKSHKYFSPIHTGQSDVSYHRGDSWFWVNNLTAVCLARIDHERYREYIKKILEASANEMLCQGALGHAAEVSSAKEMTSDGCVCQAWSAAMLLELLDEPSL